METKPNCPIVTLRTSRTMPSIGFGTYQLKGEECVQAVKAALEAGYRHIDSASVYRNSKQIRTAIQLSGILREQLYITSKIGPKEQGYEQALAVCDTILSELGTDYLDLLLIHWPGAAPLKPEDTNNSLIRLQTWRALIELQRCNKVRDIGVSNFLLPHLAHLMENSAVVPAVNQIQLHPFLVERPTIQYCRKHNIVVQAYSPLARSDPRLLSNERLLGIAKRHNCTVPQVVLRWLISSGFVVLPKSKTAVRIKQNIDLFFSLSEQEVADIEQLSASEGQGFRTCWDPHSVTH